MPTVTYTYHWLSDAEGWTDGGLNWFTWDAGDGDPAPGCIHIQNGAGFGYDTLLIDVTWENLGVPVGATVTNAQADVNYKQVSLGPNPRTTMAVRVTDPGGIWTGFSILTADVTGASLNSWQTLVGAGHSVTGTPQASGTNIRLTMGNGSVLGFDRASDGFFDELVIVITYTGGPPPPTTFPPRSVGEISSHAALIDSGVPVGPGSGSMKARSAGVIAHAALVDHCDSAIEVYLAGAESGDLLSSTTYSAPTVFTLPSTASSGHNYILQLPAIDLAKFASGRLGFVKFRYAGGTTRDCAGDLVLGGIEIIYNEKTVT